MDEREKYLPFDEITRLASEGANASDIALLLDLDEPWFISLMDDRYGLACRAYRKGVTSTRHEINKREINYAAKGSPAAVKNYFEKIAPRQ